jgi:hypothetical protein
MKNILTSARSVAALSIALLLAGCSIKDDLLEPQQPGVIQPEATAGPVGANALRIGALDRLRSATEGQNDGGLWSYAGLLADEWKSGDTFVQRIETDQRSIQTNNAEIINTWRRQHRARQSARDGLLALQASLPSPDYYQAQMFMVMGFAELGLAENWCSGVPMSELVDGVPVYGSPLTTAQATQWALNHLDTALTLTTTFATDTAANTVRRAIQILRARALVDLGGAANMALAVAAVNGIPTNYKYLQTHSLTTFDVAGWSLNNSQKRWVVSDSFDASGRILNAIPFASAGDPRVPVQGTTLASSLGRAFDNSTQMTQQTIWGRSDAIPLLSGVDARLIEAESQLQANNLVGMIGTLNTLRASAQYLGSAYNSPVMAALPTPPDQATAAAVFFREKAFWQFARGYRLNDLRRMVRQYSALGFTVANTFPTGTFFKTGLAYGQDVNFPIVTDETPNPNWTGVCIDRNP